MHQQVPELNYSLWLLNMVQVSSWHIRHYNFYIKNIPHHYLFTYWHDVYINIQGEYSWRIFATCLQQKYSANEYPNRMFFEKIPTKYSEPQSYLRTFNAFAVFV